MPKNALKTIGITIAIIAAVWFLVRYIWPPFTTALALAYRIAVHGPESAGVSVPHWIIFLGSSVGSAGIGLAGGSIAYKTVSTAVEKAKGRSYDAVVPILSVLGGFFGTLTRDIYYGRLYAKIIFGTVIALIYALAGILIKDEKRSRKIVALIFYFIPPAGLLLYSMQGNSPSDIKHFLGSLPLETIVAVVLLTVLTLVGLIMALELGKPKSPEPSTPKPATRGS